MANHFEADQQSLAHLKRSFDELRKLTSPRNLAIRNKKLYSMLPMFCKVFGACPSHELSDKFGDVKGFTQLCTEVLVNEVRHRAANQATDTAALSIADYMLISSVTGTDSNSPSSSNNSRGWHVLVALNLLSGEGRSLIHVMSLHSLPSTLVKCLYLFFDLPPPSSPSASSSTLPESHYDPVAAVTKPQDITAHPSQTAFTESERRILLQKMFIQLLLRLCAQSVAVQELVRKDDMSLLFSAVTSSCPTHNVMWRKTAADTLLAVSRHALTLQIIHHIHDRSCIAISVENLRRHMALSPVDAFDMFVTLFGFLKDSAATSGIILADFVAADGYVLLMSMIATLDDLMASSSVGDTVAANAYADSLRALLSVIVSFSYVGSSDVKLPVEPCTMYSLTGFEMPQPRNKGFTVRNMDGFTVIQQAFAKVRTNTVRHMLLDSVAAIMCADPSNYFLTLEVAPLTEIGIAIGRLAADTADYCPDGPNGYLAMLMKYFASVEYLVHQLTFVPFKELTAVTATIHRLASDNTIIDEVHDALTHAGSRQYVQVALRSFLSLIRCDDVLKDVLADVGVVEVLASLFKLCLAHLRRGCAGLCCFTLVDEAETVSTPSAGGGVAVPTSPLAVISDTHSSNAVLTALGRHVETDLRSATTIPVFHLLTHFVNDLMSNRPATGAAFVTSGALQSVWAIIRLTADNSTTCNHSSSNNSVDASTVNAAVRALALGVVRNLIMVSHVGCHVVGLIGGVHKSRLLSGDDGGRRAGAVDGGGQPPMSMHNSCQPSASVNGPGESRAKESAPVPAASTQPTTTNATATTALSVGQRVFRQALDVVKADSSTDQRTSTSDAFNAMCCAVYKMLTTCMRDSHRTRTSFRKAGCFTQSVSVVNDIVQRAVCCSDGTLSITDMRLISDVFTCFAVAMRYEPANAHHFHVKLGMGHQLGHIFARLPCFLGGDLVAAAFSVNNTTGAMLQDEVTAVAESDDTFLHRVSHHQSDADDVRCAAFVIAMLLDFAIDAVGTTSAAFIDDIAVRSDPCELDGENISQAVVDFDSETQSRVTVSKVKTGAIMHPGAVFAVVRLLAALDARIGSTRCANSSNGVAKSCRWLMALQRYTLRALLALVRTCEGNRQTMCGESYESGSVSSGVGDSDGHASSAETAATSALTVSVGKRMHSRVISALLTEHAIDRVFHHPDHALYADLVSFVATVASHAISMVEARHLLRLRLEHSHNVAVGGDAAADAAANTVLPIAVKLALAQSAPLPIQTGAIVPLLVTSLLAVDLIQDVIAADRITHSYAVSPPAVHFDMSCDGFGALYLPNMAPTPLHPIPSVTVDAGGSASTGGVGVGSRPFPFNQGMTFVSWFRIVSADVPSGGQRSEVVRLLTIGRCVRPFAGNRVASGGSGAGVGNSSKQSTMSAASSSNDSESIDGGSGGEDASRNSVCFTCTLSLSGDEVWLHVSTRERSAHDARSFLTNHQHPQQHVARSVSDATDVRVRLGCRIRSGDWHHMAVVLNRHALKSNTVTIFINGRVVVSQKLDYISQWPGYMSSHEIAATAVPMPTVYAFIGTPPMWRHSPSRVQWQQGPCQLFEMPLGPLHVAHSYRLRPHYTGCLQSVLPSYSDSEAASLARLDVVSGEAASRLTKTAATADGDSRRSSIVTASSSGGHVALSSRTSSTTSILSAVAADSPVSSASASTGGGGSLLGKWMGRPAAAYSTANAAAASLASSTSKSWSHVALFGWGVSSALFSESQASLATVPQENVTFNLNASAVSSLTLAEIRSVYSRMDNRLIARQLGLNAGENATPIHVLHNAAGHLCGAARSLGAVVVGYRGVRVVAPSPACYGVQYVGGCTVLLGLVSFAHTEADLHAALQLLVWTIVASDFARSEMDALRGHRLLAHLLRQRSDLLSERSVDLLFALATGRGLGLCARAFDNSSSPSSSVSTDDALDGHANPQPYNVEHCPVLAHASVFTEILCDVRLWQGVVREVQRHFYARLYALLTRSATMGTAVGASGRPPASCPPVVALLTLMHNRSFVFTLLSTLHNDPASAGMTDPTVLVVLNIVHFMLCRHDFTYRAETLFIFCEFTASLLPNEAGSGIQLTPPPRATASEAESRVKGSVASDSVETGNGANSEATVEVSADETKLVEGITADGLDFANTSTTHWDHSAALWTVVARNRCLKVILNLCYVHRSGSDASNIDEARELDVDASFCSLLSRIVGLDYITVFMRRHVHSSTVVWAMRILAAVLSISEMLSQFRTAVANGAWVMNRHSFWRHKSQMSAAASTVDNSGGEPEKADSFKTRKATASSVVVKKSVGGQAVMEDALHVPGFQQLAWLLADRPLTDEMCCILVAIALGQSMCTSLKLSPATDHEPFSEDVMLRYVFNLPRSSSVSQATARLEWKRVSADGVAVIFGIVRRLLSDGATNATMVDHAATLVKVVIRLYNESPAFASICQSSAVVCEALVAAIFPTNLASNSPSPQNRRRRRLGTRPTSADGTKVEQKQLTPRLALRRLGGISDSMDSDKGEGEIDAAAVKSAISSTSPRSSSSIATSAATSLVQFDRLTRQMMVDFILTMVMDSLSRAPREPPLIDMLIDVKPENTSHGQQCSFQAELLSLLMERLIRQDFSTSDHSSLNSVAHSSESTATASASAVCDTVSTGSASRRFRDRLSKTWRGATTASLRSIDASTADKCDAECIDGNSVTTNVVYVVCRIVDKLWSGDLAVDVVEPVKVVNFVAAIRDKVCSNNSERTQNLRHNVGVGGGSSLSVEVSHAKRSLHRSMNRAALFLFTSPANDSFAGSFVEKVDDEPLQASEALQVLRTLHEIAPSLLAPDNQDIIFFASLTHCLIQVSFGHPLDSGSIGDSQADRNGGVFVSGEAATSVASSRLHPESDEALQGLQIVARSAEKLWQLMLDRKRHLLSEIFTHVASLTSSVDSMTPNVSGAPLLLALAPTISTTAAAMWHSYRALERQNVYVKNANISSAASTLLRMTGNGDGGGIGDADLVNACAVPASATRANAYSMHRSFIGGLRKLTSSASAAAAPSRSSSSQAPSQPPPPLVLSRTQTGGLNGLLRDALSVSSSSGGVGSSSSSSIVGVNDAPVPLSRLPKLVVDRWTGQHLTLVCDVVSDAFSYVRRLDVQRTKMIQRQWSQISEAQLFGERAIWGPDLDNDRLTKLALDVMEGPHRMRKRLVRNAGFFDKYPAVDSCVGGNNGDALRNGVVGGSVQAPHVRSTPSSYDSQLFADTQRRLSLGHPWSAIAADVQHGMRVIDARLQRESCTCACHSPVDRPLSRVASGETHKDASDASTGSSGGAAAAGGIDDSDNITSNTADVASLDDLMASLANMCSSDRRESTLSHVADNATYNEDGGNEQECSAGDESSHDGDKSNMTPSDSTSTLCDSTSASKGAGAAEDSVKDVQTPSASAVARAGTAAASGPSGVDEGDDMMALSHLLLDDSSERISHIFRCARIHGLDATEGVLLFGIDHFYILDDFTILSDVAVGGRPSAATSSSSGGGDSAAKGKQLYPIDATLLESGRFQPVVPLTTTPPSAERVVKKSTVGIRTQKMAYEALREVLKRRYLLQPIAVEIFFADGRNQLLAVDKAERDKIYSRLVIASTCLLRNQPAVASSAASSALTSGTSLLSLAGQRRTSRMETSSGLNFLSSIIGEMSVTQRWVRGELSNFEYIMTLNTLAGRTYNDLMQYPVFPWVLADYWSDELDLTSPSTFRDLAKPMGAQTHDRLKQFRQRYAEWDAPSHDSGDGSINPPYHYGTHYSSAMIVSSYLVRLEPFTQHFLSLQGGHFDLADRMFHSIGEAWLSASRKNMADVRELIPEFFYLPDFLANGNRFTLGAKQDGRILHDVQLPPWAKGCRREFIRMHAEALECDYVSLHLHHWIDLIFGYKQHGEAAVKADNVFHHLFYEGNVNIFDIEDPLQRNATIGFINNFGQVPKQLFRRPHPARTMRRGGVGKLCLSSVSISVPSIGGGNVAGASSSSDGAHYPNVTALSVATGDSKLFYHNVTNLRPSVSAIKELRGGAVGQIYCTDRYVYAVESNKVIVPTTGLSIFSDRFVVPNPASSGSAFDIAMASVAPSAIADSGDGGDGNGSRANGIDSRNRHTTGGGGDDGVGGSGVDGEASKISDGDNCGGSAGAAATVCTGAVSRYVSWGHADFSFRLCNYETDTDVLVCEPHQMFGQMLACVCPSSKVVITGGTSSLIVVYHFFNKANTSAAMVSVVTAALAAKEGKSDARHDVKFGGTGRSGVADSGLSGGGVGNSVAAEMSRVGGNLTTAPHSSSSKHLSLVKVLYGHTDSVTCLKASPAWCIVVSGSCDRTAIIWDLSTYAHVKSLAWHCGPVADVAINEASGDIVTCSGSRLYLWDVNGRVVASVDADVAAPSRCPQFTPLLPAAGASDIDTSKVGSEVTTNGTSSGGDQADVGGTTSLLSSSRNPILCLAVSQLDAYDKENVVLTGSADGVVRIWSVDYVEVTRRERAKLRCDLDAALSRNLRHVPPVSLSPKRTVDTRTTTADATTPSVGCCCRQLADIGEFGPAESDVSVGKGDEVRCTVHHDDYVWSPAQLVFRSRLTMHTSFERLDNPDPAAVTALAVSPDHKIVYVGDQNGRLYSWTVSKKAPGKGMVDHWWRDDGCDACSACQARFVPLYERRHHCRSCGLLFCAACSSKRSTVPQLRITADRVRVCHSCYDAINHCDRAQND